jgi:hypothetical protein
MWKAKGREIPPDWLSLEPVEVLFEVDGPRIFTCRSRSGELLLAYQCGEEKGSLRFLVVPFSPELEWQLTEGKINLREALTRPRAWLVDLSYEWQPIRCWELQIENVPAQVLPAPGVMLWAHLRPVSRTAIDRPIATTTTLAPVGPFSVSPRYAAVGMASAGLNR